MAVKCTNELVFTPAGRILWECEDVFGGKREFTLTENGGIWIPPYILHTYHVEAPESAILVLANTMFNPDDPRTHDTYSQEYFARLQEAVNP